MKIHLALAALLGLTFLLPLVPTASAGCAPTDSLCALWCPPPPSEMSCRLFPYGLPLSPEASTPADALPNLTCNDYYGFNCHTSFGWYCMIYVDHTICYRPL